MASGNRLDRRSLVKVAGLGAVAALARPGGWTSAAEPAKGNGNLKQSVCQWCYKSTPLDELVQNATRIGYKSVELLGMDDAKKMAEHGLTCAMLSGACTIPIGFNDTKNHDKLVKSTTEHIDYAADHKLPNVIVFSGNRRKLSDEEGMANCVEGLKRVVGHAEEKKVTLCMELLNSKVNHPDYMCDNSKWGVELVKQVGSPRFKLLYDIYHMQIMEGDVIRTIQQNKDYYGHYHTGGNPGRHEIDETQELNYPAICKAILETGFDGYLAQEFIPVREPMASLEQGFKICDV
jgi:hydroxypyruvate isomerase